MSKIKDAYLALMDDEPPKKEAALPKTNLPPEIAKGLDMHNVRSPMSMEGKADNAASSEESNASSAKIANAYKSLLDEDEPKKQVSPNVIAAGAGAATGAFARYKGAEFSGDAFKPGKSVFAPNNKQIEIINAQLRALTNDPKIDVRGMTQDQVNRLLSGGEGSTLGTTGRQRTETFNLETQRRAEHQKSIENMVKKLYPNVQSPLAAINEPMVQLDNSLVVPASTATQVEGQKTSQDTKALTKAQADALKAGRMSGMAKIGQGTVGGALTAAQAYDMSKQKQPIDWTQYLSLLGGIGTTFGGPRLGTVGGLAQIPYAIKHREEIARGMGLGEINPTAFGGSPEALETPINSALGRR
jgi:hypothetical protein